MPTVAELILLYRYYIELLIIISLNLNNFQLGTYFNVVCYKL